MNPDSSQTTESKARTTEQSRDVSDAAPTLWGPAMTAGLALCWDDNEQTSPGDGVEAVIW